MKVTLKHHYGWREYDIDATTIDSAAYTAVRLTHRFLTDSNHTHNEGERVLIWGGAKIVFNAVDIVKKSGGYWFGVEYRKP